MNHHPSAGSELISMYSLDTTVAVDAIVGPRKLREFVRKEICGKASACSVVWIEYNRTLVADCAILHNIAQNSASLEEFLQKVDNNWYLRKTPRRLERCRRLRDKVVGNCERRDGVVSLGEVLAELRLYALHILPHRLKCLCRKENPEGFAEFGCHLEKPLSVSEHGALLSSIHCNAAEASCRVPDLLKESRANVERALHYLLVLSRAGKADSDQAKLIHILSNALAGSEPKFLRGERSCFAAGDLLICICAPKERAVVTTNTIHFRPLVAGCAGKLSELVREPPAIRPIDGPELKK